MQLHFFSRSTLGCLVENIMNWELTAFAPSWVKLCPLFEKYQKNWHFLNFKQLHDRQHVKIQKYK